MEANTSDTGRRVRWTYAEFARLPTSGSTRHEIVDDELVVTPAPGARHQRVVGRLLLALGSHAEEHGLGEVLPGPLDVLLAEGDYLEPDLLFVRTERLGRLGERGMEGPPDLVGEVIPPA